MSPTSDINDPAEHSELADNAETQAIDWIEILSVLWNSRKLIALVAGSATVLSVIVSDLLWQTEKCGLAGLVGFSELAAPGTVLVIKEDWRKS